MTLEETRQLGIEFERRIQTMIPETELYRKLDTETIYSFLNQYQDKYIHDIYNNLDNMPSGSKISARFERVLQEMLKSVDLVDCTEDNKYRSKTFTLPKDFYLYLNSTSTVEKSYRFKQEENTGGVVPNQLISRIDLHKLIETPYDSMRILRKPVAVLEQYSEGLPRITVIYDRYTEATGITVTYYKEPAHFTILDSTACELPMDAFDDLVSGAVELYVQYVAGAESKRRQQQEAAQKRAREDQRDARRSGGNQDEQA